MQAFSPPLEGHSLAFQALIPAGLPRVLKKYPLLMTDPEKSLH